MRPYHFMQRIWVDLDAIQVIGPIFADFEIVGFTIATIFRNDVTYLTADRWDMSKLHKDYPNRDKNWDSQKAAIEVMIPVYEAFVKAWKGES
jgi:hypothetical protein